LRCPIARIRSPDRQSIPTGRSVAGRRTSGLSDLASKKSLGSRYVQSFAATPSKQYPATLSKCRAPGAGRRQLLHESAPRLNRGSDEFLNLKPKTQRDYGRMLNFFGPIEPHPADAVRRRHIRELRKALAGKGRTQQLFGQVASLLFNFAADNDYCETNPASRMKRVGRARAYKAWADSECVAFEASNPPRHVMTGYMLGRYTGQRRGDVLKMARNAYNAGLVAVKPSKTERYAVTTNSSLFPRTHALGRISPTYLGTRSYSLSMKPAAR